MSNLQIGQVIADTTLYMRERARPNALLENEENPFVWSIKRTSDLFAGKRVLVFGLPGAFTPTCSNSQLPGYEEMYDQFMDKGIDEIWCTSVNDAFVMYQWACHQGIKNVKMLPDGNGDFAGSLDMMVDKRNLGFGARSWRYAVVLNDMRVEELFVEPDQSHDCPYDPYGVSAPENVLNKL